MFRWFNVRPGQFSIFNDYEAATAEVGENRIQAILKSLFSSTKSHNTVSVPPMSSLEDVLLIDIGAGRCKTLRDVRKLMPGPGG